MGVNVEGVYPSSFRIWRPISSRGGRVARRWTADPLYPGANPGPGFSDTLIISPDSLHNAGIPCNYRRSDERYRQGSSVSKYRKGS